jgi:two-component system, response regulator PdtaR
MAPRVVIADDEAIIRLDLKEILEEAGYDVVAETGRGDEVVALVATHQPDLAILDIKMPGLDGIEAARRIVAEHELAVLLLTAFSQRDLIEQARDAGVSAYLVKPFRKNELIPAVEAVLNAAREDRALAVDVGPGAVAEDKLATRRVVDEAKGVLMDVHGLDEAAAFSFIQQTAMQTRARMADVARAVVEGTLVP